MKRFFTQNIKDSDPEVFLTLDKELMMFKHEGFWLPMDTSREYQTLNSIYKSGKIPWTR